MFDLGSRLHDALIDRYTIERELGRGGMSIVYLARDLRHDRLVALKVLRPELAASLGPERFLREIKLAAGLAHPHILPLHDSGDANGLLYYVMPYVEGESLRQRLEREHRLTLEDALEIAREIAGALAYAHEHNIVHRDIKPENILLQSDHAVVSDFGIARAISAAGGPRVTATGIAVGTPDYMSPEQASGQTEVDGRADIYSLGCVLYEMLAGRPPFNGTSADSLLGAHRAEPAPSVSAARPAVPVEVDAAIERAMAKLPAERFQHAAEFAAALTSHATPSVPRAGIAWGVAATLALATVAWVVWELMGPQPPNPAPPLDATRIAVLYFDDLSPGRQLHDLAGGITQDLIDQLGQVQALRVISSNGVRLFRETNVPLDSIARRLEVGTIVTGSVERSRQLLRVTVRLIDAATGAQLHSLSVQRPLGDLFMIQDSIAADVATSLRERLGREVTLRARRTGARSVAAWELVQRADRAREDARALIDDRDRQAALLALQRADSLLARAEVLDGRWIVPVVARAEVALSEARQVWQQQARSGAGAELLRPDSPAGIAFAARIHRGLGHTERALRLKRGAPEALAARGTLRHELWVYYPAARSDTLVRAAEADLRAAVEGAPGLASAWYRLSLLLDATGRFAEADQAARRAYDADAYLSEAPRVMARLFFTALGREDFADARHWCAEGRRRFASRADFIDCELRILGWSGRGQADVAEAWHILGEIERQDTAPRLWADRRMLVAAVLARTGLAESARAVARSTRDAVADSLLQTDLAYPEAYVQLLLGARDEALRLLEMYLRANPQFAGYLRQDPRFRPLQGDGRFQALLANSAFGPTSSPPR